MYYSKQVVLSYKIPPTCTYIHYAYVTGPGKTIHVGTFSGARITDLKY